MKRHRPAPDKPARSNNVTLADDPLSITDPRVRMLHRLGTIERAVILYGEVALLPPLPVGPVECPAGCCYCTRPWAVVA